MASSTTDPEPVTRIAPGAGEPGAGRARFARFLAGPPTERVFRCPTGHPSRPTGFCPCDRGWLAALWFYARAWALLTALRLPFNGLKLALLRRSGARIGRHVFIATDVWIDPTFPQLLEIADDVMIGVGVRIFLHEFGPAEFRAGRVTLGRGAIIGGCSVIGPGADIGSSAVVAGGAVVGRDVPPGCMAVGNPSRNFPLPGAGPSAGTSP